MHSAVNGIIKRKISIMSWGISRKYHHHHHLDHLCKRQWHSQSGSWTSAADESMMICSVCGLTGLYLTQLLLCLSITSSASVTNKYSYKYLCSIYKWNCQNDLHLNRLFLWNITLWHLVSRSSNKGKLWSEYYCVLSVLCMRRAGWGSSLRWRESLWKFIIFYDKH